MFEGKRSLNPLFFILLVFLFNFHNILSKYGNFIIFLFTELSKCHRLPNPSNFPLVWAPGSPHTWCYGSNSRVAFFFFWSGWVYKQQQPVAAQLHSDPCRYSLGWATSALSDNTRVRRGICDETGFVEQERLTWPRGAVSDAVASKLPVSVSSSPSRLSAKKTKRHIARKS